MPRRILLIAVLAAAALTLPATAQAEDFCVGSHPSCPIGATIESQDMAGFSDAAAGANLNPGSDRIYVAADTYTIAVGLSVVFTDDVEIRGEGVGQTIFTSSISGQDLFNFNFPSAASFIEDFTIAVTGAHSSATGLEISGGQARDFKIDDQSTGTASGFIGLALNDGATASDFDIELDSVGTGVSAKDGPAAIDHATILGPGVTSAIGVDIDGLATEEVKITHSVVRAFDMGIKSRSGKLVVSDTLVDMDMVNLADGFYLFDDSINDSEIDLTLERVTVYGNAINQYGVYFGADGFGAKVFDGTIEDSVIELAGSGKPLRCIEVGDDLVEIALSRTAYDFGAEDLDAGCVETKTNNIDIDGQPSQFVNAAADDFTPAVGSLLIDAGSDGSSLLGGALDLAGNARLNDGSGDCVAKLDLGAYEFQLPTQPQCLPPNTPPTTPPSTPPTTPTSPLATAKLTTRARKAFKRSKSGFRKRTNPRATSFGVTFKNAQVARFEIQKIERGVKKRGRCRRGRTGGKRCNYFKSIRGIQRQDVYDGEIFYQFGGQIGGKKLKPGNYRVEITPFGEGAVIGKPIYVPFKLK